MHNENTLDPGEAGDGVATRIAAGVHFTTERDHMSLYVEELSTRVRGRIDLKDMDGLPNELATFRAEVLEALEPEVYVHLEDALGSGADDHEVEFAAATAMEYLASAVDVALATAFNEAVPPGYGR